MTITKAALLALCTAVISGGSNYIAKIAVTVVKNPVVFTSLKNGIVAAALIGMILLLRKWKEIRGMSRKQWVQLTLIGVIGGSIPFILFFTGLTLTTAASAAFIHKTLFIWVTLLAIPFLKERIGWIQGAALALLLTSGLIGGGLNPSTFGRGELMIFGATIFWAVENIIAKKALANLSSVVVAGSRMVFGSVILFAVIGFQGNFSLLSGLSNEQWLWTLIPSALLLGYVVTWYTALKFAPASVVASLLVPATFITNMLSYAFLKTPMTSIQWVATSCVIVAVALLLYQSRRAAKQKNEYATSRHTA